jgi:hypothetical protein
MALICMARPVEDCVIETQSDWGYSLGVGEWKGPTGHILGKEVPPLQWHRHAQAPFRLSPRTPQQLYSLVRTRLFN